MPYNAYTSSITTIDQWCYLSTATNSYYDCHFITAEYYTDKMYIYGRRGANIQTNMGSDLVAGTVLNARGTYRLA